jgi:ApbE superfamily uncharacterized protein (UPF0280 family)
MMHPRAIARMLPDNRRLHLQDGPIDLIVEASGERQAVCAAYEAATKRFATILDELCAELPLLRAPVTGDSAGNCSMHALREGTASAAPKSFGNSGVLAPEVGAVDSRTICNADRSLKGTIAQKMFEAVQPYAQRTFITPMAAVAGAVAETVLESMTSAAELRRAYVNNGGDIALHLTPGESFTIGMVDRPDRPSLFGSTQISSDDPIRGVATSGWRGRSFSLGIADAVTVLADTAAVADAAATVIANAVDLPGHPLIIRKRACDISPDSDLRERLVTRGVGELTSPEIERALDAGTAVAGELLQQGLIRAAALSLGNTRRIVSPSIDNARFIAPLGVALHA